MHEPDEQLSLAEAAKIAPGRPSTNCIWRWCRKGVLARDGQRVRLKHTRIGGKIYTTAQWIEEFGQRLAEADSKHFDLSDNVAPALNPSHTQSRTERQRQAAIEQAEQELADAGV